MESLKNFIRTAGAATPPESGVVDAVIREFPWFTAAHAVRRAIGGDEPLSEILRSCRAQSSMMRKKIDVDELSAVTEGEIIDRFLRLDDYRIVADESDAEEEVRTEAEFVEEDDLVSEDLAEVYAAQGMNCEAVEIYSKLSLLNPEKSVYFAEKIEKLRENN